ncbi:hypothetical protein BGW37DRAFT_473816 [Umbelopsis sp. PMI_123]|nr:hypothetical protein BGW37DRAFT_473816 [Umbelopsis sp. PMI_123]
MQPRSQVSRRTRSTPLRNETLLDSSSPPLQSPLQTPSRISDISISPIPLNHSQYLPSNLSEASRSSISLTPLAVRHAGLVSQTNDSLIIPSSPTTQNQFLHDPTPHRQPFEKASIADPFSQPTTEERLRILRHDALQQHLYETAAYFGEKVVAKTGDTNDVYWLAQVYHQSGQFDRAADLLKKKKTWSESVACRFLAAQCAIELENWKDALDLLGHDNPFANKDFHHVPTTDGGIKLEASMCYVRGQAHMKLGDTAKAKACFKEALIVDVKCYNALDALLSYNMFEEHLEWDFIYGLPYQDQCGDDADLFRSLYIIKLKKYSHQHAVAEAQNKVERVYGLGNSVDVMQSRVETLLAQSKFEDCLAMCKRIRREDEFNTAHVPAYLTCLYELKKKTELFEFANELVKQIPQAEVTWYGVGMYYFFIKNYTEARRYFSQVTTMNQYFAPAWLAFGHTFAVEKEHDQAISAYATSARLIPGSHLPLMYLGMQYMDENIMEVAYDYLQQSLALCDNDPFLLNELAVYHYSMHEYEQALEYLEKAEELAKGHQSEKGIIWEKLWCNFGHVHRKLRNYEKSFYYLSKVLSVNPKNSDAHATIGMIYHLKGKIGDAIAKYHEALKNSNTEVIVTELLEKALLRSADSTLDLVLSEDPDATIDSGGFDVDIENWDMSKAAPERPRRLLQTPKLRGNGKSNADVTDRSKIRELEYDAEAEGTEILQMEASEDPFLVDHGDLDPNISGTFFLHKLRTSNSPSSSAGSKRKHSP